jgi:hypothetical protein
MTTVTDPRFLRQFSRLFCRRSVTGRANSHVLAGRRIEICDSEGDIEVRVVDAQGILVGLLWSEDAAWVVEHHTVVGLLAEDYDDNALTTFVRLFLRRHRLLDHQRLSTQKGVA